MIDMVIVSRAIQKKGTTEYKGFLVDNDKLYRLDFESAFSAETSPEEIRELMDQIAKNDLDGGVDSDIPASERDARVREYIGNGWTLRSDMMPRMV